MSKKTENLTNISIAKSLSKVNFELCTQYNNNTLQVAFQHIQEVKRVEVFTREVHNNKCATSPYLTTECVTYCDVRMYFLIFLFFYFLRFLIGTHSSRL